MASYPPSILRVPRAWGTAVIPFIRLGSLNCTGSTHPMTLTALAILSPLDDTIPDPIDDYPVQALRYFVQGGVNYMTTQILAHLDGGVASAPLCVYAGVTRSMPLT